ncbi:MAG: isoprenylcysteine carboxylmethyltransferase family protein [Bacteroidetes bacterium]|nr:isoprenylcysteine carboxylmethyltransferase family protein [Bacteroidota bacterium]
MEFYQIVLPIFTVVYLLQVFVIQSYIQWKKTGVKPYVFSDTDSPHDYCGKIYKLMIVGTWISIAFYSLYHEHYELLVPIWYLEFTWLQHVGFGFGLTSFVWIIMAQKQMSGSWRIGINYKEKTILVKTGVFRISRNPIFLGVMISYLGTFLIIPNMLTFGVLLVTFITLQIQVRLEEDYLTNTHGNSYVEYTKSVRRWI